uniref:Pre-mRNA 3'-end-processing factor FIP1 n=1 Tax=Schistosoma japonicum TaxID=6182 RepID=C1LG85_SCHJA|nr:Pre-mRNA 3'-end-processing factor FIP1 [Schistosoma japonicum]
MDNETLSADGCIIDNADSSAADANQISGEDIQTEAVDELRLHENDSYPYVEEEKNAVIAAAVADFDVDDHCEENDGDDDTVNVIIKPSSKTGIYKTGATYQARSVSHTTQRKFLNELYQIYDSPETFRVS